MPRLRRRASGGHGDRITHRKGNPMRGVLGWLCRNGATATGFLAVLVGLSGGAMAYNLNTPEIDPGSMVNSLLVLSGGLILMVARRPRK
jgi:hypothetical protein